MSELHISISAEPVIHFGDFAVTNSMLTTWIVTGLLIAFSLWFSQKIKAQGKPSKLQALVEMIIEGFFNLIQGIAGSARKGPLQTIFVDSSS